MHSITLFTVVVAALALASNGAALPSGPSGTGVVDAQWQQGGYDGRGPQQGQQGQQGGQGEQGRGGRPGKKGGWKGGKPGRKGGKNGQGGPRSPQQTPPSGGSPAQPSLQAPGPIVPPPLPVLGNSTDTDSASATDLPSSTDSTDSSAPTDSSTDSTDSSAPTDTGSSDPTSTDSTDSSAPTDSSTDSSTDTASSDPTSTDSTDSSAPTDSSTDSTDSGAPTDTGSSDPTSTDSTDSSAPTDSSSETDSSGPTSTDSTDSSAPTGTDSTDTGSATATSTDSSAPSGTASAASATRTRPCDQGDQSLAAGLQANVVVGMGLQAAAITLQGALGDATAFPTALARLQQFMNTTMAQLTMAVTIADKDTMANPQLQLLQTQMADQMTMIANITGVASDNATITSLGQSFLASTDTSQDGAFNAIVDCYLPLTTVSG